MRYVALAGLVALAACGASERAGAGPVVRDSAGISIVENQESGGWREGEGWRVSTEPLVDIGGSSDAPEYQFFLVYDAARLRDGRIVVVNSGSNELRFYDQAGEYLYSVGRQGEGPGEFMGLQLVWPLEGDSLLAYDFYLHRLSIFTGEGEYVRSFRLAGPEGRQLFLRGRFADGSLLVETSPLWIASGSISGVFRDSVTYLRFDPEGALLDTIGSFPSSEYYRLVFSEDDWTLTSPPFPRSSWSAAAGERFYFGASDRWEVEVYAQGGALERIIRLDRANRAVGSEDIEKFKADLREAVVREGGRAVMVTERMLAAVQFPKSMPAYRRLVVDSEENLWVQDYRPEWEEESRWTVFGPEGELLGRVELPDRFEVFRIGADFVLGAWTDELGVEHLRLHSLVKG